MKLNRRMFLVGGGSLALASATGGLALGRPRTPAAVRPVDVTAIPIDHFSVLERDRQRFGALTFRSGLDLRTDDMRFGGFSGLWRSPDGRELVAVADNSQWLTAGVETRNGRLAGLTDVLLGPML